MKILVVQESDWLERNPHQQHHLMERMAERGHQIKVIDYPIDWPNDDDSGLIYHKEVHENVSKIKENTHIEVIRPGFIKIKGLNYATLFFTHKKEIEHQIDEFKPDVILALGILNSYNASRLAKKHNIPFVYYFIDVIYALIPEKAFQKMGQMFTEKTIRNADLVITINKKLSEFAYSVGAKPDSTILIDAGIDLSSYDPDLDDSAIREEYGIKSARSYDDDRRRIETWLGEYMGFKSDANGKNVFISIDSRAVKSNPLFKAWKTCSFTDKDITLHFIILDILKNHPCGITTKDICDVIENDSLGFVVKTLFKTCSAKCLARESSY
jgi:hypothetical protein